MKILKKQRVGHGTWYHFVGNLNWFAEVVQSGRLHTHSFWEYLRQPDERKALFLVRDRLLRDKECWIRLLGSLEADKKSGGEYLILSASEVREHPELLYVIQSNASGDNSVGYLHGNAEEGVDRQYGSGTWGVVGPLSSSHAIKLRALRMCLEAAGILRHPMVLL